MKPGGQREARGQREQWGRGHPRSQGHPAQASPGAVVLDQRADVETKPRLVNHRGVAVFPPPAVELDVPDDPLLSQAIRHRAQHTACLDPALAPERPLHLAAQAETHAVGEIGERRPAGHPVVRIGRGCESGRRRHHAFEPAVKPRERLKDMQRRNRRAIQRAARCRRETANRRKLLHIRPGSMPQTLHDRRARQHQRRRGERGRIPAINRQHQDGHGEKRHPGELPSARVRQVRQRVGIRPVDRRKCGRSERAGIDPFF